MKGKIGYLFTFCLLLAFLNACKDKEVRPLGSVPEKDFVRMLAEMHIADAMSEYHNYQGDSLNAQHISNLKIICSNHGYSIDAFKQTYAYYTKNPYEFDRLYLQVIEELTKQQLQIKP